MHREAYLDLLRIFSVILVMLSHFVGAGSWAQVIPGVINPDLTALPLIDATQWSAYLLESFLFEKLQTQPAVLGVSIFFLITGYLMPIMCDRYSRKNFLLNRFFRIFPTFIAAVAMIGIFLFITEKITFGVESYLASITLTYQWVGVVPVMGVLWTLVVEVIFYFIAFFIGTFTFKKLVLVQSTLLVVILLGVVYRDQYHFWLAGYQARFLLFILIGSAFHLAEMEEPILAKLAILLPSIAFSYIGFQLFKLGKVDTTTYQNLSTHLIAVMVFLGFHQVGPALLKVKKFPKPLSILADLVYSFYLIHVAIGLVTMALVREYIQQPYFLLLSAILTSLVASFFLHKCIEKPGINLGRKLTSSN